jgi:ABC-type uncharacterized transport system auxiliary subunit
MLILMKKIFLIVLVALAMFSGCRSNKAVAPRFYLLEYPVSEKSADTIIPLPFTLEIVDIEVNAVFATNQIALRENEHEVKYFVNHMWATRPQQSLEAFTLNYFNHNPIFAHTQNRFWNIQPDYKLFIIIYNLEALSEEKDFSARLHMELRLESKSGEVIERNVSNNARLLPKRNLNLFAKAINNIYYEELNYFAKKIHFILSPAMEMD